IVSLNCTYLGLSIVKRYNIAFCDEESLVIFCMILSRAFLTDKLDEKSSKPICPNKLSILFFTKDNAVFSLISSHLFDESLKRINSFVLFLVMIVFNKCLIDKS